MCGRKSKTAATCCGTSKRTEVRARARRDFRGVYRYFRAREENSAMAAAEAPSGEDSDPAHEHAIGGGLGHSGDLRHEDIIAARAAIERAKRVAGHVHT